METIYEAILYAWVAYGVVVLLPGLIIKAWSDDDENK